jgi:hypothetical protein
MACEWNQFDLDGKKKYSAMEQKDKERYVKDKAKWDKYLIAHPDRAPPPKTKGRQKGGKSKEKRVGPKRSTSAFFYYQADRRLKLKTEQPDLNHKEIVSVSTLVLIVLVNG